MLNLNSLMVSSENPKALAEFYGRVLEKEPDWKDETFIGYKVGSCFITIGPHSEVRGKSQNPERIIFFFETTDVNTEFERIKSIDGVSVIKEPYNPAPSGDDSMLLATLSDPDGNYFQLASPWNG